jgi:hypothetical protein
MGVLRFYSIENSIHLIGTCLKIVLCPTYVEVETLHPTPCYPILVFFQGVYFSATMALAATGL